MSSVVREYLNTDQLAEVGPWSVDAIQKMVSRGSFQRGVHYFQPLGRRTKLIFKWSAVVALIEGDPGLVNDTSLTRRNRRVSIDVQKATTGLHRLLSG